MKPVYLALGSNLGNREEHLRSAIRGLGQRGMDIIRCASVYSTEPRERFDQPWFLNTVLEVRTNLPPGALLRTCLEIEHENLRTRDTNKGPRTLDIDILFYGNEVIHKPGLSIPHPALSGRRFVLEPLAEIAPDFVDPLSEKTIRQLLASCGDAATVTRVSAFPVSSRPSPSAPQ